MRSPDYGFHVVAIRIQFLDFRGANVGLGQIGSLGWSFQGSRDLVSRVKSKFFKAKQQVEL